MIPDYSLLCFLLAPTERKGGKHSIGQHGSRSWNRRLVISRLASRRAARERERHANGAAALLRYLCRPNCPVCAAVRGAVACHPVNVKRLPASQLAAPCIAGPVVGRVALAPCLAVLVLLVQVRLL